MWYRALALALHNFTTPVVLLFSWVILREQVGPAKIVGAALIVTGGLVAVLL